MYWLVASGWEAGEKKLSQRLSFIVLWTLVGLRNVATDRRNIQPFTYGVDPNAELRGVKGHHEAICVGVDGRWVLVDGTSQQRSCRVVTVQHCGQQRCCLLLCAADSDRHTLSYRQRQWSTMQKNMIATQSISILFFKCQPLSQWFERRLWSLKYLSLKIIRSCSIVVWVILFMLKASWSIKALGKKYTDCCSGSVLWQKATTWVIEQWWKKNQSRLSHKSMDSL